MYSGNKVEKDFYKGMTIEQFVHRLLEKRCASFFGPNDKFLLLSGDKGASGFVEVGTENEKHPLMISNVLSYDEIKVIF